MRIAHLSDLHLLSLDGVPMSRLIFNKRLTGMVNIKLRRGAIHKREVVEAVIADVRTQNIDHVVVTGDITNLALETEFALARRVLDTLGIAATELSVVPGNHDVYTSGAARARRFEAVFADNIRSEIPPNEPGDIYPFIKLRPDVAIIGVSSAVPRLPLISAGLVGQRQRETLTRWLQLPEVQSRAVLLMLHHPLINPRSAVSRFMRGLDDAKAMRGVVALHPRVLAVHGHLHDRLHHLEQNAPGMEHVGATSSSLIHHNPLRCSSYNIYTFGTDGLTAIAARTYQLDTRTFADASVPRREHEPMESVPGMRRPLQLPATTG